MCVGGESRRHKDKREPQMNTDEHRLRNRSSWALAMSPRMTGRGEVLGRVVSIVSPPLNLRKNESR
jgi:hypothetical protein